MSDRYKIPIERLKKAGVEVKKGNNIILNVKNKKKPLKASITDVGKEFIIATVKENKKKTKNENKRPKRRDEKHHD